MAQDRNLQLLGLARKAGLLAVGCEASGAAARSGKSKLIISASDASERAQRNARINAEAGYTMCTVVPYTKFELGNVTGRGSPGTVAFLDKGLAVKFLQGLAQTQPEPYEELWEFLEKSDSGKYKGEDLNQPKSSTPSGKRRTMQ
ncbi:MAG: 50S ribosomal protein L7 [Oscillospiraceae bacterium]|nr:50S ribosomal protein L7 [Oscillospiraceae bacterium]